MNRKKMLAVTISLILLAAILISNAMQTSSTSEMTAEGTPVSEEAEASKEEKSAVESAEEEDAAESDITLEEKLAIEEKIAADRKAFIEQAAAEHAQKLDQDETSKDSSKKDDNKKEKKDSEEDTKMLEMLHPDESEKPYLIQSVEDKFEDAEQKKAEKKKNAKKVIKDVPHINQIANYPTGCESVSTVCCLQYMGIDITVDKFIDKYLRIENFTTSKNGELAGPNLDHAFLGNPYSNGTGCYPGAIINAIYKMGLPKGMSARNLTGCTMKELCEEYIDKDIPVIFWATCSMKSSSSTMSWVDKDTGEKITFLMSEHCLLLVGYDKDGYYFSDPLDYQDVTHYDKEAVEYAHYLLDHRAVAVIPKDYDKR